MQRSAIAERYATSRGWQPVVTWRDILRDTTLIERLALVVFAATLYYMMIGFVSLTHAEMTETDAVSPINRYIWIILLAMSGPILVQRRREILRLLVAVWPILILYAWFLLSTQWALDPPISMRRFIAATVQLILFTSIVATIRRPALLHAVTVAICLLAVLLDLAVGAAMPGFAFMEDGFAGVHAQKNQAGIIFMVSCLAIGSSVFLTQRLKMRIFLVGATLVSFALLVLSRSETSISMVFMSAGFAVLFMVIRNWDRTAVRALLATLLLVPIAGVFGYVVVCAVQSRDPMAPFAGVTFSMRTDIWNFVLDEISKRPWLGAGYSSFWAITPSLQPSLKAGWWYSNALINEAHNGYLDMLATNGWPGLVLCLLAMFIAFGRAVGTLRIAKTSAVAWLDGSFARPTAYFYILLMLSYFIHNMMESDFFTQAFIAAYMLLIILNVTQVGITAAATRREGHMVIIPAPAPAPSGAAARAGVSAKPASPSAPIG